MRHLFLLTTLLLACLVPQEKQVPTGKPGPESYDDEEAYKVYAEVLPKGWVWTVAKATGLVIQQETTRYPNEPLDRTCIKLDEQSKKDWQEVIDNYLLNNQTPRVLLPKIPIEKPYELVPRSRLLFPLGSGNQRDEYWIKITKRVGNYGGILSLSAVGFNRTRDRAIVYMGHHCGGLCGGGTHYFLEKIDGKWNPGKVSGMVCSWAS